ncbi:MAG: antibiotic biosynthesis monooxygenase [Pacificimonas sp.]
MAIAEVALLPVRRGEDEAFAAAFAEARTFIEGAEGFLGLTMRPRADVDSDDPFLLIVRWTSVAAHRDGFRGSPAYHRWRALLHPFYDDVPPVHYVVDRSL